MFDMYNFLKELCKEKGTSVSQLCIEVTGNSGNLATWKKGYIRSDYLSKCADVLGVSTDLLLGRENIAPTRFPSIDAASVDLNELSDADLRAVQGVVNAIKAARRHSGD